MKLTVIDSVFAPIDLIKLRAYDCIFAVEKSKIDDSFWINSPHLATVSNSGAMVLFRGKAIPMIDYRSSTQKFRHLLGASVIVVTVLSLQIAIIVQQASEKISVRLTDIESPCESVKEQFPFCEGQFNQGNETIHLIDLDKFLRPALAGARISRN